MIRYVLISSFWTVLTSCYGSVPPRPTPITLPALSDDAPMNLHSRKRTVMETQKAEERICPADVKEKDSPKCLVATKDVVRPVTHVLTTVTLGADVINYAQFRVLTDPDYNKKVARLDALRDQCRRATVPRWITPALVLGGLVTALVGASDKNVTVNWVGWGSVAGGTGTYLLGYYYLGGRECHEAWRVYNDVDLSDEVRWTEADGVDRAAEMKMLAERFNDLRHIQDDAPMESRAELASPPSPADSQ